ncbi:multicopper oxidase family protein [Sorangium sp. So ce394]|uniref:multicopper oxidase family protein n=1 Tax=Sorangium sp. So ce394 TaxID=3133310 RepID=UPI003F5BEF91
MPSLKRRLLLKYGLSAAGGLVVLRRHGLARAVPRHAPTLHAGDIPRFTQPLAIPQVMPRSGKHFGPGALVDYYEIAVRQFQRHILPPELGLPPTTVWGYGSIHHPETFSYPAFTIEAEWRRPVRVKWINDLKDPLTGRFLPHLLPVDPTLHWANPPGGLKDRDSSCKHTRHCPDGPYRGPVPIVTHLHGIAPVAQEFDGHPEAWYLPAASDIPPEYARTGTYFDYFKKNPQSLASLWEPGAALYEYPNDQRAATLWYHDHTLGITRVNVYAGPAGFYLIRGGPDDLPPGVLPGPPPRLGDCPGTRVYEIPLVIQDRTFKDDGSLYYPESNGHDAPAFGTAPGHDEPPPIWVPAFVGNAMVVNGRTWPYLEVEQRRYRFRVLNACNTRYVGLRLSDGAKVHRFWVIGTDAGGFLPAPVEVDTLTLGPSERADLIVDFTNIPVGAEILLLNVSESGPTQAHLAHMAALVAEEQRDYTTEVMLFRVVPATSVDTSTPPDQLTLPCFTPHGPERLTRPLLLTEKTTAHDRSLLLLQGIIDLQTGQRLGLKFHDRITEDPDPGDTEIWELHNDTYMPHPIHVHNVEFQVLNREDKDTGAISPPEPWETGFKDTVNATENAITRIKMKFRHEGAFIWHCHILEHEDNEMMRPYHVGPIPLDLPHFGRPHT